MKKHIGNTIENIALLALAIAMMMVHFQFFHGGYFGYDELEYCNLAHQLIRGDFEHGTNLYAYRYVGFLPLAGSYMLLGVNDFANFIVTVLATIAILFLVLKLLPSVGFFAKGLSVLLLICNPIHLLYLEKPMPDVWVELGFLLCFYSYYRIRFTLSVNITIFSLLFMGGAILTFLAKETFLIFYPYFLGLLVTDVLKKQRLQFWVQILIGTAVFTVIYLLTYQILLGDALARVQAIFHNRYVSECTYELQPISVLLKRISYQLWLDFIRSNFLLPLLFLPLIWKKSNPQLTFLAQSWIALLLLSNFMTISYTNYVPLCNDSRHFIFVLPLGAMLFAHGLEHLSDLQQKTKIWMFCLLLFLLFISVSHHYENTWLLYLPLLGCLILFHFYPRKNIFYVAFMISILSIFFQNAKYHLSVNHKEQKALIDFVLSQPRIPKLVVTDRANTNIGNFYAQYDTARIYFIPFEELKTDSIPHISCYLILNGMTMYLAHQNWESLPAFAKTAHENLPKLLENTSGVVYKMVD